MCNLHDNVCISEVTEAANFQLLLCFISLDLLEMKWTSDGCWKYNLTDLPEGRCVSGLRNRVVSASSKHKSLHLRREVTTATAFLLLELPVRL